MAVARGNHANIDGRRYGIESLRLPTTETGVHARAVFRVVNHFVEYSCLLGDSCLGVGGTLGGRRLAVGLGLALEGSVLLVLLSG